MASYFPDGSTVHIATGLAAVKNITAISNANPAVCTSAAHGLANGDVIVLSCGWSDLDERVFRIANVANDTFQLVGADTRDTRKYPAGQGASATVGSCRKVNSFTEIRQIAELTTQGGEQQYANFGYLGEKNERQMPTTRSPRSIQFKIGDDPSLAGYKAAKAASDSAEMFPLRIDLVNGGQIYFNGHASLNEMPSLSRGQLMTVDFNYAVAGEPTRY